MEFNLIWLRRSTKRSLKWLRRSMNRSINCFREFMQLVLGNNNPVVLAPESITLFSQGISLKIPSQQVELQMTVPNFEKNRFNGIAAECLRRNCEEFKQKIVKETAAQILAFFIQPNERCIKKVRCGVEHVEFLLHELVRISFTYSIRKSMPEATEILFNLHQYFLPGKHRIIKELGKTLCWTGKDLKKKLRKDEELGMIRTHRANRDRKISRKSRSQRLKYRAYFV